MDTQEIVATVKNGNAPSEWNVWPLHRGKLMRSSFSWLFIGLFGTAFLIYDLIITIPSNFTAGFTKIALTLSVYALVGVMGLGGLYLFMRQMGRYLRAGEYFLIMTADEYIKVEPGRVFSVPMGDIGGINLQGVRRSPTPEQESAGTGRFIPGLAAMFGFGRRSARGPTRLTFIDQRTGRPVIVAEDNTFDDLGALDEILRMRVHNYERRLPV